MNRAIGRQPRCSFPVLLLGSLVLLGGLLVARQWPEIRRYARMKRM